MKVFCHLITFAFWMITRKIFKISNLFTKNFEKFARAAAPRVCVMLANKSVMKVLFMMERCRDDHGY